MKPLINNNGSINVHDVFMIPNSEKQLKVIGSESLDWMKDTFKKSAWQTKDTVKNLGNGKLTEITRTELFKLKPYIK